MDSNSAPQESRQHRGNRGNRKPNPNQRVRVVRKLPPRVASERRNNIYITSKTDFKAQLKRCEDLLNAGAKEIYLHCLGYSITRGLNLALRLIQNSEGALKYAINTSTIELIDELHPLCDEEDLTFRQRNNSALHIKIYNSSLFDIVVPKLPAQPALPADHHPRHPLAKQQTRKP